MARRSRTRACASSSRTSFASAVISRKPTPPSKRPPARSRDGCDRPAPPQLREGVEQFNAGRFFEQHETLELLWRVEEGTVRDLYHGILQIGVGLHHRERGNLHGAVELIRKGIRRLEGFGGGCQGVDVPSLVAGARRVLDELERKGSTQDAREPAPIVRWLS